MGNPKFVSHFKIIDDAGQVRLVKPFTRLHANFYNRELWTTGFTLATANKIVEDWNRQLRLHGTAKYRYEVVFD